MKKPKYRLFTILSVVFLILGILMTTVGGHFSTVLTVAMEGSTTDKETAEMTYADGLAMNVELEEEGLVLLKNENQTLPLSAGKVNVFGHLPHILRWQSCQSPQRNLLVTDNKGCARYGT